MIMAAVVQPAAFSTANFNLPGYKDQAFAFLKGIEKNGLLLVDSPGRLRKELVQHIASLSTPVGQKVQGILPELLKGERKRIFTCDENAAPNSTDCSSDDLSLRVAEVCQVDGLVTGAAGQDRPPSLSSRIAIVPLQEYLSSDFEAMRDYFYSNFPPVDAPLVDTFEEMLVRSVRFSRWLRFYDSQIGRVEDLRSFGKGIEFILNLWLKCRHFVTTSGKVEIITPVKFRASQEDILQAQQRIYRQIISPLQSRYGVRIDLRMKYKRFHDRYLDADSVILSFGRGFDLFDYYDKLRPQRVRVDNAVYDHLRELRESPDCGNRK